MKWKQFKLTIVQSSSRQVHVYNNSSFPIICANVNMPEIDNYNNRIIKAIYSQIVFANYASERQQWFIKRIYTNELTV